MTMDIPRRHIAVVSIVALHDLTIRIPTDVARNITKPLALMRPALRTRS